MRSSRAWWAGALGYAVLVAVLTLAWSRGSGGSSRAEAATFALTLPASLVTLPLTYGVLATVWNLAGAGHGGPGWFVAAAYGGWFAVLAMANMALATAAVRSWRTSRQQAVAAPRGTH